MPHHNGFDTAATPQQRHAMRATIVGQCFGTLAYQALTRGLALVYLTKLGISSTRVLVYLSLPFLLISIIRIPCAMMADRYGIKRLGVPGLMLSVVGFIAFTLAGNAPPAWQESAILVGCVVFAMGEAMMQAGWFALLSPIVPPVLRGRYFGRLRMSWQTGGVLYIAICGAVLAQDASVSTYQILLGFAAVGLMVRIVVYAQLPELEPPSVDPVPIKESIGSVIRAPGYASFCAYVFLLGLCTGGSLIIFGMVEKNVLALNDNLIVWLGNATMIGAIIGFSLGGRAVDRYSTRPVFLVCHFGFGAVLLLFLARHLAGDAIVPALAAVHLLLGMLLAASSIAISTELLALIPPMNKSLSTTMADVLLQLSASISGLLAAWVLDQNILADNWQLGGATLSAYDSILMLWAILVLLFVVTLGLVPSVIRKAQWMPGGA